MIMLQLHLSQGELEAALPFLGARLEKWRAAVASEFALGSPHPTGGPGDDGPELTDHSIYVSSRGMEVAYAAFLSLRTCLLDRLTQRDGMVALRAMDPVLRAVEGGLAQRQLERCIENGRVSAGNGI